MEQIREQIKAAVASIAGHEVGVEFAVPDPAHGDLSTNVAMQLARDLHQSPRDIAQHIVEALNSNSFTTSIEGPGFINVRYSDATLISQLAHITELDRIHADQCIVIEYSDPNPFKVLHAGHLYTSVVGDAIANLLEHAGAVVHRVNFGGDVGLHVGKTMWAIVKILGSEDASKLEAIPKEERSEWLTARYVEGNNAFEEDDQAKAQMVEMNKRVYQLHTDNDHDSGFAQIYWTCRQWSYDYFDGFYSRIGTKFEKYYPESETATLGLKTVREHVGSVYQESNGAVIFNGEEHGLHARVFINSEGLPTYEAKDVGLIMTKWQDYHFDKSVIITGNDIIEYMKVVLKSVEQFEPELSKRTVHLTHGIVKLKGGEKMSSRKGNILRAADVLDAAAEANRHNGENNEQTVLGAVKYAFLKVRTGGDIIYNPEESVSLDGNSGPYLQYAHARASGVLKKSGKEPTQDIDSLTTGERQLIVKLAQYRDVIATTTREFAPHGLCTYLYELAQVFNRFYEDSRVIGDDREAFRLYIIKKYVQVLGQGLGLLGIDAPERM